MNMLKDALDEVLGSEIGEGARVCLWQYLSRYHVITAHNIDPLEKMQGALRPVGGEHGQATCQHGLFALYGHMWKERRHEKELDQRGISN